MSSPFSQLRAYQRYMRWQGYQAMPIEQFGGLDLRAAPDEAAALDMLDVDLDVRGALRTRDLFTQLVANTTYTDPSLLNWGSTGFIASTSGELKLYNNSGTLINTASPPDQYYTGNYQAFGTPTTSYMYLADPSGTNTIRRLTTGGVVSAPAGMPRGVFLSMTPWDKRLVAANIGGTSVHRVQFSDPGAGETWGANNWVDLDPGDGEQITAAVAWRDRLFIFKQSKFFVFYGTSIDGTGNPIFNYRSFSGIGGGVVVAAGHDGVYYFGPDSGLYRTIGGEPVVVSRKIAPIFLGNQPSTFTLGALNAVTGTPDWGFANNRFHVICNMTGTANRILFSYDPLLDAWLTTDVGASKYMTAFDVGEHLLLSKGGANAAVYKQDPTETADDYRAPTSRYRSGFVHQAGGAEGRIREAILQGIGTVTFKGATDWGSLNTGESVVMGTSPAIAEGRARGSSFRGRNFSWQVSGTGAWTLERLVLMLAGARDQVEQ